MEDKTLAAFYRLLLIRSSPTERDILNKAWDGDMESSREALCLACMQLECGVALSPAMRHWIFMGLISLRDCVVGGPNGWVPVNEALEYFGHEPMRGRPSLLTNAEIDQHLRIIDAVLVIAKQFGKTAAIAAVAHAVPMSESKVWALSKQYRRVKGLGTGLLSEKNILCRVLEASRRDPHIYSKEMRDFLEVTAKT